MLLPQARLLGHTESRCFGLLVPAWSTDTFGDGLGLNMVKLILSIHLAMFMLAFSVVSLKTIGTKEDEVGFLESIAPLQASHITIDGCCTHNHPAPSAEDQRFSNIITD